MGGVGPHVSHAVPRGPYIEATLSLHGHRWGFLFPGTEDCARVLRAGTAVTYVSGGPFGRMRAADGTDCDPVGIGTLKRWRPERPESEAAPESPARWEILHEDEQVYLLRGRFPVAGRLGVPEPRDVVAMVRKDDVCTPIAASGSAVLVFHPSGDRVLDLDDCPVLAVATPL